MSDNKPIVKKDTFLSLDQKGRDGVLYDYMSATYEDVQELKNKEGVYTKRATQAGAIAGLIGGVGTFLTYLGAKFFGTMSW